MGTLTSVRYGLVKYASGPWDGKWVVRKEATYDLCACLTRREAGEMARALLAADRAAHGANIEVRPSLDGDIY